ncbi:MAG: hypothetical protein AB7H70_14590 [Rhodospirillaceae bacterium]
MSRIRNRLDRLENLYRRIRREQRNELLLVEVGETVKEACSRKYPDGVPEDVCLLTIQFV